MSATCETPVTERQMLLVGPYGVLGTGVIDAVAENPKWGITTARCHWSTTLNCWSACRSIQGGRAEKNDPIRHRGPAPA